MPACGRIAGEGLAPAQLPDHSNVGDGGRIRARAVSYRDAAFGRRRQIDTVIAGAVANDGAELRQQIHGFRAEW